MKKHYPQFSLIGLKNFFVLNRSALNGICIALLFFMPLSNYAQKGKTKDFILTACVQDIGNGMYQVTFSYNNPNTSDITVTTDQSVLKKNGKLAGNGVNIFKKGNIISAFRTQFYKTESVEWSVVNPNGKIQIVVATAGSALCPIDQVSDIVPVYGLNGKDNETKLGLELTSLAQGNAGDKPSEVVYFINPNDATEVLVEIIPKAEKLSAVLNLLTSTFGRVYNSNPELTDFLLSPAVIISNELTTIDVYFPKARLLELISIEDINFVRPSYQAKTNSGIVTSQGDKAQKSDTVRNSFRVLDGDKMVEVNGRGVKVGVISDSFDKNTALSKEQTDINNGDLPGIPDFGLSNEYKVPVEVLMDYPFLGASDEGRAMLQIVHDVAPGAELAFHTGIQSPRIFELALQNLETIGSDIIVDDITFPLEPFFVEGRISAAIRDFTNKEGNLYFTSAGNFANNGYQAKFAASGSTPVTNFLPIGSPARAHVFGSTGGVPDVLQKISVVPGVFMLVLQWEEPLASQTNDLGATTDLDIYLVDDAGKLIVGNNRKNEAGDPTEVIVFEVLPSAKPDAYANIMIVSANGVPPADLDFKYTAFRVPDLKGKKFTEIIEYGGEGAPTVSGHAMTPEAITVAAVDYINADNPVTQNFSSWGGSLTNGVNLEIDLSAPDGVNTNVASIGQDRSSDEDTVFTNFFGTSAAAPHAAGAFALLMSAVPNWYPDGLPGNIDKKTNVAADKALTLVKSKAKAFGSPEKAGAGLIDLEAAFSEIANKTPIITELVIADKDAALFTDGIKPYQVSIIGENFTEDTEVILNGIKLNEEDIIINTENEIFIVANIDSYSGNPIVQVQTLPKEGSVNNGGLSPEKPFFEDGRQAISIIAENKTFKYGQKPEFTYTVKLPDGFTYEQTGLPAVKFQTSVPAEALYADVNNYTITPSFDLALTEAQLAAYQINFVNGILTVEKNELTIKAADLPVEGTPLTYGDKVEVDLEYEFDETGFTTEEANAFRDFIEASHKLDFFEGDINKSILLIDDLMPGTDHASYFAKLLSGSWITTETNINNINNGKVIGVPNGKVIGVANSFFIPLSVSNFEIEGVESGFPNGKVIGVPNGKVIGVPNGKVIGVANAVQLLEDNYFANVLNGKVIGVPNGKVIGVANTLSLGDVLDKDNSYTAFSIEDEFNVFNTVYAVNLITGKSVTTAGKEHLIAPGAFLHAVSSNFKVTYQSGKLSISSKELKATTNKEIKYGEDPIDGIVTQFEGFAFDETPLTVFTDGKPEYYFVDETITTPTVDDELEAGDKLPVGVYNIKIRSSQNYIINSTGKLTVTRNTLEAVTTEEIKYGEEPLIGISTTFGVFAFEEDTVLTVFPDGIPYYFVDAIDNEYESDDKLPVGIYNIKIRDVQNYTINSTGTLTVIKNTLTANSTGEIKYGEDSEDAITTEYNGFEFDDTEATVFPDGIPYYFVDAGNIEYELGAIMPVGVYSIMVRDTELKNYTIVSSGQLTVSPATLQVSINDLVINQGETINTSLITPAITGYIPGEDISIVFPQGITYKFINDANAPYVQGATGVYNITIEEPVNYDVNYTRDGKVYVNSLSGNVRKVRTYLDCIEVKQNSTNGLNYIANFRYDNPNSETIYVLRGEDNRLTGEAIFSGETPIMFLPGENTFKIEFDGRKLIWTLTTFDNTQKSSVSSEATSDSGKCDAKGVETATLTNYLVGPNPTTDGNLTIKRNIAESGTVDLFSGNGVFVKSQGFSSKNSNDVLFTVPGPGGLYYLRINAGGKIYMFNIIKN